MKIAVCSDIHDRLDHLSIALHKIQDLGAEVLLFLGDFCAPFSLAELAKGFSGPIHVVFGNNDGDLFLISQIAQDHPHVKLHGLYAELDFGNCKIAINHYPNISQRIAQSGVFNAVFSGHDHQQYVHRFGDCLWANPGEIMGRFGNPSFGIYETETGEFQHVALFEH